MENLIIFYPCWNDSDWIQAATEQIEYWGYGQLYFCEGCFDPKFPARSTDGTREFVMDYKNNHDNVYVIDNIRTQDYRTNQAMTCNLVLELSKQKENSWIMYQASDFFMLKKHIDIVKGLMKVAKYDYPIFEIWNFWNSITKYWPKWTDQSPNLPYRIAKGAKFIPTCHLSVKEKMYKDILSGHRLKVKGFHYEGMRSPERLKDKYAVGDRQSPVVWKGGEKLKNRQTYTGVHPEFAIPVLKEKGFM